MFKARRVEIEGKYNYTVMLLENEAKDLGLNGGDRVRLCKSDCGMHKRDFLVCDLLLLDPNIPKNKRDIELKKGELGVFENVFSKLGLKENQKVTVLPAESARSTEWLKDKFAGKIKLNDKQFVEIVDDIIFNRYTDVEKTLFVLACAAHGGLDDDETIGLTKAMINAGKHLDFRTKGNKGIVADKHCIGGVPANRTTMLVVPICAAAGLTIPKSSSRAITSPAGTADTMEVLANVELDILKMERVVQETGACIIWGGALDLSPADDIIIEVEHPLKIDSEGQMIASILSKKVSAGATHVLLDIPVGHGAKYKDKFEGIALKRRFEVVGKAVGLKMKVVLSDGSAPIGKGIGPLLEAEGIQKVLNNSLDQCIELREKAIWMSGQLLEFTGHSKKGKGVKEAKEILDSGKARMKFDEIVRAQGSKPKVKLAKLKHEVRVHRPGKIMQICNKSIAKLAFALGNPVDKGAGLYLHKKVGDKVEKGDVLFEIYTNSETKMKFAKAMIHDECPYRIK